MSSLRPLLIFLLFCSGWADVHNLYAQYDQVWMFGNHAGLDFNHKDPEAIESVLDGFGEGSASISDQDGQLLFYTEGTIVWDKKGHVMPGGKNLLPLSSSNEYTTTSSSAQGALIIPEPGSTQRYYIFSLTSIEQGTNLGRLYYSVVDMRLNNGLGGVDLNEKGIFLDSGLKEQMTSIVGEKCNVWLMVRSTENVFKAYNVSASGINRTPRLSDAGTIGGYGFSYTGQMSASPNGRKLATAYTEAFTSTSGCLELFDFDPATGSVSHPVKLDSILPCIGVAFSPDNSKLYASFIKALYQFDLNAAVPAATKILITNLAFPSHLKLGPNGKIYGGSSITPQWQHSMSVVNFPDLSGTACQFIPDAVQLVAGSYMRLGLSNVINYVTKTEARTMVSHQESPCWFRPEEGYALPVDADGWDYTWDDGSIGKNRVVDSPGQYWVTYYTAPCQLHTDTFWLSIPYGVLPHIAIETSCANRAQGKAHAYTHPGDTVTYQYVWRNGQNDILSTTDTLDNVPAGSYSVQITTLTCDTILWVEIPELKDQVSFSVDSLFCVADTVWFENTSDSYYTDFSWTIDGRFFSDAAQPYYLADRQGQFAIQLAAKGRICQDTAAQLITVDSVLKTRFTASADSICVGQEITLTIQQKDFSLLEQTWLLGEARSPHGRTENIRVHAFNRSGLQPITLRTVYRVCPEYAFTDTIFVEALPIIDLGADSSLCLKGSPVILENKHSLASVRYSWNTGDTSGSIRVKHPGTYTLTVYTISMGCSSTEVVNIKKNCYLDVPNAFSPNGDGYNDFFFPRAILSQGRGHFHMQIFNRWGQLVFETKNTEGRGWDGQWNERVQPPGVYIYRIEVGLADLPETYTGNVTLLR